MGVVSHDDRVVFGLSLLLDESVCEGIMVRCLEGVKVCRIRREFGVCRDCVIVIGSGRDWNKLVLMVRGLHGQGLAHGRIAERLGISAVCVSECCEGVVRYSGCVKRILRLFERGVSAGSIAGVMGLPRNAVVKICSGFGAVVRRHHVKVRSASRRGEVFGQRYVKRRDGMERSPRNLEIARLRKGGCTYQLLSDKFGITKERVRQICEVFVVYGGGDDVIVRLRRAGWTDRWIAEYVGCPMQSVSARLKRSGLGSFVSLPIVEFCSDCSRYFYQDQGHACLADPSSKYSRHGFNQCTCAYCGEGFTRSNYHVAVTRRGYLSEGRSLEERRDFCCTDHRMAHASENSREAVPGLRMGRKVSRGGTFWEFDGLDGFWVLGRRLGIIGLFADRGAGLDRECEFGFLGQWFSDQCYLMGYFKQVDDGTPVPKQVSLSRGDFLLLCEVRDGPGLGVLVDFVGGASVRRLGYEHGVCYVSNRVVVPGALNRAILDRIGGGRGYATVLRGAARLYRESCGG